MEHMCSFNLLAKTLPRILVSIGNSEMGRYDETKLGSRPGLGISEMLALYKVGGNLEFNIE